MTFSERLLTILRSSQGHCAWFEGLSDTKLINPRNEEEFRILQRDITEEMLQRARLGGVLRR